MSDFYEDSIYKYAFIGLLIVLLTLSFTVNLGLITNLCSSKAITSVNKEEIKGK